MADVYRFGEIADDFETYLSGDIMPHRMQYIERQKPDGVWERLGYVEIHLHKVKRDETDAEDISVGITVRVNPKK